MVTSWTLATARVSERAHLDNTRTVDPVAVAAESCIKYSGAAKYAWRAVQLPLEANPGLTRPGAPTLDGFR